MNRKTLAMIGVMSCAFSAAAVGSPVAYTFSTGALSANNPFSPSGADTSGQFGNSNAIAAQLAGTTVSGTFFYDAASPLTGTTSGGSLGTRGSIYGGSTSGYTTLAATVNGTVPRSITDPRGFAIVGDDDLQLGCFPAGCTPPPPVDFFNLQADNTTGTSRNLIGFTLGNYRVWNVRLFWQEGQAVPNLVPDFLSNANEPAPDPLPSAPPTFNGRLAIDFVLDVEGQTGNLFQYAMFYDNLLVTAAIPEPETYALLLAGLGLLGFVARRRHAA